VLSNVYAKKYLHLTVDAESQVSRKMEVSLCDVGNEKPPE